MTDQINRVLAEKVMGWREGTDFSIGRDDMPDTKIRGVIYRFGDVWNPCEDWSDAGMVVEKMLEKDFELDFYVNLLPKHYYASFFSDSKDSRNPFIGEDNSGPAAISKAAYEAITGG